MLCRVDRVSSSSWTILRAHRDELGALRCRFERASDELEVSAELTVRYSVDKGLASLEHAALERVVRCPRGMREELERELALWVREHEDEVFTAAMRAA